MSLKFAIILAAGKGTRMQSLSLDLPKPLLKVDGKTFLQHQIAWAKNMGVSKIFINTFYKYQQIEKHIKDMQDENIICVRENKLLGSGGGITNILHYINKHSEYDYLDDDLFCVANSDAFIRLEQKKINEILVLTEKYDKVLLTIEVSSLKYNSLKIENKIIKKIIKSCDNVKSKDRRFTYTGFGFFKLKTVQASKNESSFFDSVARYKEEQIYTFNIDNSKYQDLGTAELYNLYINTKN